MKGRTGEKKAGLKAEEEEEAIGLRSKNNFYFSLEVHHDKVEEGMSEGEVMMLPLSHCSYSSHIGVW